MKKIIGISLIILTNIIAIWFCIFVAIFKHGIVVNGSFSLELADDIFYRICTLNAIIILISIGLNFIYLKYLIISKRPILVGVIFSLFAFVFTIPFLYRERINFLENGKQNAFDLDIKIIKEIKVQNLKTNKIFYIDKNQRELIWELEYLINNDKIKIENNGKPDQLYKIEISFKKGNLIFTTKSKNLE